MTGICPADRRAVITGLGVVACNGIGKAAFWDSVVSGHSGIDFLRRVDTDNLCTKIGGEIRDEDFDPADYMDAREAKSTARFVHFAIAAAQLAVQDSGLDLSATDPLQMGAYFGTSTAGQGNMSETAHEKYLQRGVRVVDPTTGVQVLPHAATARVFIDLGMRGPNTTFAGGCAAALDAIEESRRVIAEGRAEVMVAGGTDSCMNRYGLELLCRLGVFSRHNDDPTGACRPYDRRHDGLVVSEGAGAVVIESARHARERGATIYAEVLGHGAATEAQHLVAADPTGVELAHAMRTALIKSRLAPEELDYVCAHGIGNADYDRCDTNALKFVLGRQAYRIPISSIKPVTGQPWTAGGAFQAVSSCMTIQTGLIPPTINLEEPAPDCDLDYVPLQARRARVDTVMMNGHSFGGTHTALVLRRFDEAAA